MGSQVESLAYLGPEGSFSHQVALKLQSSGEDYNNAELIPAPSIARVCEMVAKEEAHSGIVPTENSTDGPVNMGLEGLRRYPLFAKREEILPIAQTLFYRRDTSLDKIQAVISHPSALGQCQQTIERLLPGVPLVKRDSTSLAVKEAAEDPRLAGIGSRIAATALGLEDVLMSIHDIHDSSLNATRFFVVDTQHFETPLTGDDKTSLIVQTIDQPGGFFRILDALYEQGINLSKVKSFGKNEGNVSFFITIAGHQRELPLNGALTKLVGEGVRIKVVGSYPRAEYTPPQGENSEIDMEAAVARLRSGVLNGVNHDDHTVVAFTLRDEAGALRNSIEPFARHNIDLAEIESITTGELGKYAFYLSFRNGTQHKFKILDELATHCTRVRILE